MTDNLPVERKPSVVSGAAVAAFVPQTLEELYRLSNVMATSGLSPFKTPEAAAVAIMAGAELGFSPFQSCQSLASVNGRAVLWGDAIPALLWANGFKLREWYENEAPDYPDDMVAKCEVTRPDGQKIEGEFSVKDAKDAQLWTKTGPWQTAKKRMMKMRARSFAARDGASDLLRGLFVAEEAQDFTPIPTAETGTGMKARLEARQGEVDAPGFNVRSITDATTAALDVVLEGDNIPNHEPDPAQAAPKRRGRPPKAKPEEFTVHTEEGKVAVPEGSPPAMPYLERDEAVDAEFTEGAITATETIHPMTTDGKGEFPGPQATDGVLNADAEPDSKDSATDASGDLAEETSSQIAPDTPSDDGVAVDLDNLPESPVTEPLHHDVEAFYGAMTGSKTFSDAKASLIRFRRTDTYRDAAAESKNDWQITTVNFLNRLRESGVTVPDHTSDPWVYSIWQAWAVREHPEFIGPAFQMLKRSPAFAALSDAQRDGLEMGAKQAAEG